MGDLANQIDRMRVTADVARGALSMQLEGRDRVSLSLRPGVYQRVNEQELERELTNLARLLLAARIKRYYEILSDVSGETVTNRREISTQQDVDFYAARDEIIARGRSRDGRIQIEMQGLRMPRVRLAPGTVRALTEQEFVEQISEASRELIQDQTRQVRRLKLADAAPDAQRRTETPHRSSWA